MKFLSSLFPFAFLAVGGKLAVAQTCSNTNTGACDWEPFNPVACGPDRSCSYDNFCLARENGYDPEADCCQAPQIAGCPFIFEPVICGDKQCEYSNSCVANLAGYSDSQCSPAPPECPESTADCSGEPSNPYKCGPGKTCQYGTICEVNSAGWDLTLDCCQDVRTTSPCNAVLDPVACGPPHKQCPYDNQCEATNAGYSESQCCPAVPDGTFCTAIFAPVECGSLPCSYPSICEATAAGYAESDCCRVPSADVACPANIDTVTCGPSSCQYVNQCTATAAGYTEADCCPQGDGACSTENRPVLCNEVCTYPNQGCADLAGFTENQCCNQPIDLSSCPAIYAPIACSTANCIYDNDCIAELAGFDPNSCVKIPGSTSTSVADGGTDAAASTDLTAATPNVTASDGDEMPDPPTNEGIDAEPLESSAFMSTAVGSLMTLVASLFI